jgi:hypothetical protein
MPLSDIVNVQITRQTISVSEQGFGTPMILGTFKNFNDRIRYYSNMQGVAEDFRPYQDEYIAANSVFSQPVTPTQLAIGRRQADSATVDVITAMTGKNYTVLINNENYTVSSTNTTQESTVTFSANFVSLNSIAITLNSVVLTPVVFDTDQLTTMTDLQTLLQAQPGIESVEILPDGANPNRVLKLHGNPNMPALVNSCVVTLGASQPTAAIVNSNQPVSIESIAGDLVTSINASPTVQAVDNMDGTLTITSIDPPTPWTLFVSTNIVNANAGRVTIEQASSNTLYEVTINGTTYQYTSLVEVQTNEQIAAAFVALINADPLAVVGATDNLDGSFELSADNPASTFVCTVTPIKMTYQFGMIVLPMTASETPAQSLDAIQAVDDNWYAIACTDRTSANVQAIALWTESKVKIFGTASADPNILLPLGTDTTSIAYLFNQAGYVRTFVLYCQDADSTYPECAWLGVCLPFAPGSETWMFKQLATIPYSDLSFSQSNNVLSKKANTYEYVGGVGITQKGTVSGNEYIDVVRGVDWLTSTIQSYVYSTLVNLPKVPYTDAGITAIQAQVERALAQGVANNFLSNNPAPICTVPRAIDVSSADKSARILRNVNFTATLAGAIQAVEIRGTVSV